MRLSQGLLLVVSVVVAGGCDLTGVPTCSGATPYNIGSIMNGKVGDDDCKDPSGDIGDVYEFTLTTQTNFAVTLTSTSGQEIRVYGGTIDAPFEVGNGPNPRYYLPPGTYSLVVAGAKGDYTFKSLLSGAPDVCSEEVYTLPGVSLSGTLTSTDCTGAIPAVRQDVYEMYLKGGRTVSVNATVNKLGAVLFMTGEGSSQPLINKPIGAQGGSTQFSFTAPFNGYYRVHFLCEVGNVGPCTYSGSIQ